MWPLYPCRDRGWIAEIEFDSDQDSRDANRNAQTVVLRSRRTSNSDYTPIASFPKKPKEKKKYSRGSRGLACDRYVEVVERREHEIVKLEIYCALPGVSEVREEVRRDQPRKADTNGEAQSNNTR